RHAHASDPLAGSGGLSLPGGGRRTSQLLICHVGIKHRRLVAMDNEETGTALEVWQRRFQSNAGFMGAHSRDDRAGIAHPLACESRGRGAVRAHGLIVWRACRSGALPCAACLVRGKQRYAWTGYATQRRCRRARGGPGGQIATRMVGKPTEHGTRDAARWGSATWGMVRQGRHVTATAAGQHLAAWGG